MCASACVCARVSVNKYFCTCMLLSPAQICTDIRCEINYYYYYYNTTFHPVFKPVIQTEAERRRREAGVKQKIEIRLRSCLYVVM